VPEKLEKCVADVKAQGKSEDSAWGICVDSTGEKPHKEKAKESNSTKAEIVEAIFQEKINANRQVPVFNPPITNRKVEPKKDKNKKGIGGQVGKIDSSANTNNMTTDLWKKILDSQLRRNVKEPRY